MFLETIQNAKSKCHILSTCWIKRLWNVAFSTTFWLFQPPFGAHYGSFWILWRRSGKHSTNLCLGSDPHPPASFAQEIFLDRRSVMWGATCAFQCAAKPAQVEGDHRKPMYNQLSNVPHKGINRSKARVRAVSDLTHRIFLRRREGRRSNGADFCHFVNLN